MLRPGNITEGVPPIAFGTIAAPLRLAFVACQNRRHWTTFVTFYMVGVAV